MPNAPSEPALALFLLRQAAERGTLLAILRSAGRLDRVFRLASAFADEVEVLALPPWDTLPYDRTPPSAAVVGQRILTLSSLTRPVTRPCLVLTSADAALQRVRPPGAWTSADLPLNAGETIDLDELRAALAERGYRWNERVDEPGEVALRGQVIDVFPAGETQPARLEIDEDRIVGIARYDPVTLRSVEAVETVVLRPAIEFPLDAEDVDEAAEALLTPETAPDEPLPELAVPSRLVPVFDYLPGAPTYRDPEVTERWQGAREAIDDAFAASGKASRITGAGQLPRPGQLYLTVAQAEAAAGPAIDAAPEIGEDLPPPHRIEELLEMVQGAGDRVVVIATPSEPERVAASLKKRGLDAQPAPSWAEAKRGQVSVLVADPPTGLRTPDLLLLPIGPLLRPHASASLDVSDDPPRVGETVVHLDHGVCRLAGLTVVEAEERVALEFADGAELLIAAETLDRLWRYGGEGGATLDRIGGEAWAKKRGEIEAELAHTAEALAAAAAARATATADKLAAPPERLATINRRFPYLLSGDQRAAVHDVLADLASGHPMDRLLCGDVGFGKTEIAIRAAAAAAFAGSQVAIAAPTTVLARQHLDVFRRRFRGSGLRVEGLVRAASSPENRAVRAAIKRGEVHIVIGTQGLAQVAFHKLGLSIIDEEQRFGEADKQALASRAQHVLAMTATPIPRTLQAALVGLRDVSVLATPPQNRQPTRTFVLPWDPVVVREALLREKRRGGQSFLVCPRIAGIAVLQERLAELAPELEIIVAHGRLKPEALESAVLRFAGGDGDVLLATNIIEAGLDIPRANLMMVADADRFGLAQLHQLRGRVGRGTRRGAAYFLTEPGRRLTEATRRRLATMETLSGLGAGVAISAADLDLRGAGDLFGAAQAGHLRAVGTELYQHLLAEAVGRLRGDPPTPPPPELHVELAGRIPDSYVPEANLRLALLRRLARLPDQAALQAFTEELTDRFGPLPAEAQRLLARQQLQILCRTHGIARLDAGPQACAITPLDPGRLEALATATGGSVKEDRLLLPLARPEPLDRAQALIALLD